MLFKPLQPSVPELYPEPVTDHPVLRVVLLLLLEFTRSDIFVEFLFFRKCTIKKCHHTCGNINIAAKGVMKFNWYSIQARAFKRVDCQGQLFLFDQPFK